MGATLMKQNIIREILRVDKNHQLHLNVPPEMGEEVEVIVMPIASKDKAQDLSDEDRFKLAAYAAVVEDDTEEDALWERCTHA
jgi:hypothetical protein